MTILLIAIALSYIFSGCICCVAFLDHFNWQGSPLLWQRFLVVLASLLIVIFWPAWISIEIIRLVDKQNVKES